MYITQPVLGDATWYFVLSLLVRLMDGASSSFVRCIICLLYTSPSPRDRQKSRMPSSA